MHFLRYCWYPPYSRKPKTAPAKPAQTAPAANSPLKTDLDRVSYSIGMNLGTGLKEQAVQVNTEMLQRGIKDAISAKTDDGR